MQSFMAFGKMTGVAAACQCAKFVHGACVCLYVCVCFMFVLLWIVETTTQHVNYDVLLI